MYSRNEVYDSYFTVVCSNPRKMGLVICDNEGWLSSHRKQELQSHSMFDGIVIHLYFLFWLYKFTIRPSWRPLEQKGGS